MAMTRSDLRSEVYAQLGETSGFFTDAQINQWLADGVEEIANRLEPLITNATINAVDGTGEYLLPTDLISIKRALYGGTGAWANLTETTYENLFDGDPDWEDDESTPTHWYWRQDVIGLYPVPSADLTAGLRILYTYRPAVFANDSAETGLSAWLDKAVVQYVIFRCRKKDRDEPRAAFAAAEYDKLLRSAGGKLNKHRKEHAPQVVPNTLAYRQYYQRNTFKPRIIVSS